MNFNDKKILYIWSADWPWDIRIDKQITVLKNKNANVSILARNTCRKGTKEEYEGLKIYRLKNLFKSSLLDNIFSTPICFNPLWFYKILKTILIENPNIVIIRDIPLAPAAIIICRMFGIKTILDVAEHFPALMKVSPKYTNNKISKFLICNLEMYDWIEKFSVKFCTKIIVVVEESKERFIKQYKINENKIQIVSNTPINIPSFFEKESKENLDIAYIGNIDGIFRGFHTLMDAAKLLKDNINIRFNIIGCGPLLSQVEEKIKNENLKNINLLGKFSYNELSLLLKKQDLGIVPHINSDAINYTIPNKLFDYMAESLPVIVSDSKPLKRIVEETNCGYVFEAENAESLASLVLKIYENRAELKKKSINGYVAVINKYNWEKDTNIFYQVIEEVLN